MPPDKMANSDNVVTTDHADVEEFLTLLARSVRQFHTYPSTSPMCTGAIAACHKGLAALVYRERLTLRITPNDVIVDEVHTGAGTVVEQELVRRLYRAHVATLDIERAASPRDLTRFCVDLVGVDAFDKTMTLAEILSEHGVNTIVPGLAHRPEVLDVGVLSSPVRDLVSHERRRQESTAPDARVSYLYPPDKGWVRLDPSDTLDAVSLVDLVLLVEEPADVATMLLRLTGDEPVGPEEHAAALERKFSDVTTLFSALDPRLARVMFGRLARAVLQLEPARRTGLLKRTILPGLLDGCADGAVLRDFPDSDLAEALCLLLELETAAPEVLSAALNHLDMTPERREALVPLIDERLRGRHAGGTPDNRETAIDRYVRALVKVETKAGANFSDFVAFDLSIDDHSTAAVAGVRDGIGATDVPVAQLRCVWQLIRLEPNPTIVEAFLRRARDLFAVLEHAGRWTDLTSSIVESRQLANDLRERRPDVSEAITRSLAEFCTPDRVLALIDLSGRNAQGHTIANNLVEALGPALVPGFVAVLDDLSQHARSRVLATIMCEHASLLAPALEAQIATCSTAASKTIVKVLGYAGAGHESSVAALVSHSDEQLAREALRALARIGTPTAAAVVAERIRDARPGHGGAAEEALWHFPPAETVVQVRQLFRSRNFVLRHPATVARLLDRAAHTGARGLDEELADMERLWIRFWNPGLVLLALKARELRTR